MSIVDQTTEVALRKVLDRSLEQTLKSCAPAVDWRTQQADALERIEHEHCIVLTISSYRFRVMCLLHLTLGDRTRQFVADAVGKKVDALDETEFLDYLLEMSNAFCGNLKRNLQGSCPPLGMSTPNLLDRACLCFDDVIHVSSSVHTQAFGNGAKNSLFAASLLLSLQDSHGFSLKNYKDMEAESAEASDSSGELELF